MTPTGPTKLRPDVAETAFRVMMEATGQAHRSVPGDGPKHPDAVARGSLGGKKGGQARAEKLHKRRRVAIARKAAKRRWSKPRS